MSSWLERRTVHELYGYTYGRLRELRRQVLYGEPQFRFIAKRALECLEEIKTINPRVVNAAIKSASARFDDNHA